MAASPAEYTLSAFEQAASRIEPHVRRTPLRSVEALRLKLENRQITGSFKARGALNKILGLSKEERGRGVVCASAGNHGQGVAFACSLEDVDCTVVVPSSAPGVKKAAIRAFGAELVAVPGGYGAAEDVGRALAEERDATWVSPYNDVEVILGQGTVGLELAEELQLPAGPAVVYLPASGGGLLCGVGLALLAAVPGEVSVIGVQAAAAPYLHAHFHGKNMNRIEERKTWADGLAGPVEPGSITLDLLPQVCTDMELVEEEEIVEAMRWLAERGEVVEPAAAVGVASALKSGDAGAERVVILSGGNLDADLVDRLLGEGP